MGLGAEHLSNIAAYNIRGNRNLTSQISRLKGIPSHRIHGMTVYLPTNLPYKSTVHVGKHIIVPWIIICGLESNKAVALLWQKKTPNSSHLSGQKKTETPIGSRM